MEAEAAKVGKGLKEWWAEKPSMVGVFRGTRVGGVKVQFQDAEYVPLLRLHRCAAPHLQPLLTCIDDACNNAFMLFSRAEILSINRQGTATTLTTVLKLLHSFLDH